MRGIVWMAVVVVLGWGVAGWGATSATGAAGGGADEEGAGNPVQELRRFEKSMEDYQMAKDANDARDAAANEEADRKWEEAQRAGRMQGLEVIGGVVVLGGLATVWLVREQRRRFREAMAAQREAMVVQREAMAVQERVGKGIEERELRMVALLEGIERKLGGGG